MAVRAWNCLSLCAGVGGLDLGMHIAEPGARSVVHVEREAYAAAVLVARMEAGELAPAPVWSDLATFDARRWRGAVDCVLSGDPCQPNSVAGRGLGVDDERFLADQVLRIVDECRPDRFFRENVAGNAAGQLAAFVPALERMGYRVACGIWGAKDAGGSHGRERLFLMGDARRGADGGLSPDAGRSAIERIAVDGAGDGDGISMADAERPAIRGGRRGGMAGASSGDEGAAWQREWLWADAQYGGGGLAHAHSIGRWAEGHVCQPSGDAQESGPGLPLLAPGPADPRWPAIIARAPHLEPAVRRVADGLADRVDQLRACGNGVFPLAAALAWISLDALLAADRGAGEPAVTPAAAQGARAA